MTGLVRASRDSINMRAPRRALSLPRDSEGPRRQGLTRTELIIVFGTGAAGPVLDRPSETVPMMTSDRTGRYCST